MILSSPQKSTMQIHAFPGIADLTGVVLEGANISGTDFGDPLARKGVPATKLQLERVLMAASWDDTTRFPADIDKWLGEKGIRSAPPEAEIIWQLWDELGVADEMRNLVQ